MELSVGNRVPYSHCAPAIGENTEHNVISDRRQGHWSQTRKCPADVAGQIRSALRSQAVLGVLRWWIRPSPTRTAMSAAAMKAPNAAYPAMVPTVDHA